jgi:hypothetical protein
VVVLGMSRFRGRSIGLSLLAMVVAVGGAVLIRVSDEEITRSRDVSIPDPESIFDPTTSGEPLPDGYRQALGRDDIAPVYNPTFTGASAVDWPDDSLVLGVAGADTAKAYPVTYLNQREMVLDEIEGMPILVSW